MCAQLHVCIVHCSCLVTLQGWHAFGQDLAKLASHNQANSGFQNGRLWKPIGPGTVRLTGQATSTNTWEDPNIECEVSKADT